MDGGVPMSHAIIRNKDVALSNLIIPHVVNFKKVPCPMPLSFYRMSLWPERVTSPCQF